MYGATTPRCCLTDETVVTMTRDTVWRLDRGVEYALCAEMAVARTRLRVALLCVIVTPAWMSPTPSAAPTPAPSATPTPAPRATPTSSPSAAPTPAPSAPTSSAIDVSSPDGATCWVWGEAAVVAWGESYRGAADGGPTVGVYLVRGNGSAEEFVASIADGVVGASGGTTYTVDLSLTLDSDR